MTFAPPSSSAWRARGSVGHRARIALLLAAFLGAAHPVGAQSDEAVPEVVRTKKGFSVNVTDVTLTHALTALGSEAGFTVVDAGRDHPQVTLHLEDAALDVTLSRLLRNANFMVVYRNDEHGAEPPRGGIEKIILLTAADGTASGQKNAAGGASPLAGPGAANPGHAAVPGKRGAAKPAAMPVPPARVPAGAVRPGAVPPGAPPPGAIPPPAMRGPASHGSGPGASTAGGDPNSATGGFEDPTGGNIAPADEGEETGDGES